MDIFEDLFVLELANNHWGKLERGLAIIDQFSKVVRKHNIKAAIKLQFRDVETFIHRDHILDNSRYIKKTIQTVLSKADYKILVQAIIDSGCIPMATPFDERSVDFCGELNLPIIKLASSDINDSILQKKIMSLNKPVIISTGGATSGEISVCVQHFTLSNIHVAINHCVAIYPTPDQDLQLNMIDFLIDNYPDNVIGFSSHEGNSWDASMLIAYAKGARTFERHIDIEEEGYQVSPYCSTPEQIENWFIAFKKAKEMCGRKIIHKILIDTRETEYLNALKRCLYAKRDLPDGYRINKDTFDEDFYLAIPYIPDHICCDNTVPGLTIKATIKDAPVKSY
jgi:sialic acid synthase SpsE